MMRKEEEQTKRLPGSNLMDRCIHPVQPGSGIPTPDASARKRTLRPDANASPVRGKTEKAREDTFSPHFKTASALLNPL